MKLKNLPAKPLLGGNCLSCKFYLACKDPHKSVLYRCHRFEVDKGSELDGLHRLFDVTRTDVVDIRGSLEEFHAPVSSDVHEMMLDGFDIHEKLTKALSENTLVAPDLKIPEGDFPLAPNFYTFVVADKFTKQSIFVSQALIGTKLFGEYCPRCSDLDYFDNYKVSDPLGKFTKKICLLEHNKCPACGYTHQKGIKSGKLKPYNELALCAGQRSGKSALTTMLAEYLTHRVIKLQNAPQVYSLRRNDILHGTFTALTHAQARDSLWSPFYGDVLETPWFSDYHAMLKDYERRTGQELYKLNDTFLLYKHRHLFIYPSGPDERTLRGRTRMFSAIDELGWFDNSAGSTKVKLGATGVYSALGNSLRTVRSAATELWERGFTNVPTGMFFNISSPSSIRDKIMELVRTSLSSDYTLGLIRPTWDMNPRVTKAHLADEFAKNPVGAMRDYGAQPPLSSNAFLSQPLVEGAIGKKTNAIIVNHRNKTKKGETTRFAEIIKQRTCSYPSVMTLDAGVVNNSFALTLAHLREHKYPVIDAVIEVQPMPGIRLNFSKIYRLLIEPLIETRNVQLVAADRWNSEKILSDIAEDYEIETRMYSLKYQDMVLFKDYIEDKKIQMPDPGRTLDEIIKYDQSNYPKCFKDDAIGHFYLQMMTIQDTGSSVIKGDQLTDDMARSTMLAVRMLLDEEYQELWDRNKATAPVHRVQDLAFSRGYSGGGGQPTAAGAGNMQALGYSKQRSQT